MTPEEAVLGACMLDQNVIRFAVKHVMPSDFAFWKGEEIFSAIIALHSTQQPVDVITVAAKLADMGSRIQPHELHQLIERTPTAANVEFYAQQVRDNATRRRLQAVGMDLQQGAANEALEPGLVLARGLEALKAARDDAPQEARLETRLLGDLMDEAKTKRKYDWVIPGLFERGDRMMVTGPPGKGKSTLMRQMAIFAAAGIHPFQLRQIEPLRVLVVDKENTYAQWARKALGMYQQAHSLGRGNLVRQLHLHCGQDDIDLARDKDLGRIHRVIEDEGPFDLVQIGPLYRLAPRALQTDDEAAPILAALNTIRETGACLLMEAHAVKDKNGSLAPRGSAALMGWPEFGRGLAQDLADPQLWHLEEWRGDRDERDIPDALRKGGPVPWLDPSVPEELLARFRNYNEPERLNF